MKIKKAEIELIQLYRLLLIFILCVSLISESYGQKKKEVPPPLRERIFFGGSFGLQFGSYTNIEINPIVGLWVLPNVAVAAGPGYQYYSDNYYHISTSIFSGKAYGQVVLLRDLNNIIPLGIHTGLVFHVEDELLNLDSEYWKSVTSRENRFWLNTVLIGGGLRQQFGRRAAVNILVLWVLNDSGYQIYSNPEIRIGFTF